MLEAMPTDGRNNTLLQELKAHFPGLTVMKKTVSFVTTGSPFNPYPAQKGLELVKFASKPP